MPTTPEHFDSKTSAQQGARAALRPTRSKGMSPNWDGFVRLMRVILPISAAVLAVITILWPYLDDTEVSFTLSTDEVAQGDTMMSMVNMHYVGTDTNDRLFHVEAATGLRDGPDAPNARLTDIKAQMMLETTGPATVTARTGLYNFRESSLVLVGGVHMVWGDDYMFDMAGAEVDLKNHTANGQGSITGSSKLGTFKASQLFIDADKEIAIFEGGVSMHIIPKRPTEKSPKSIATGKN